MSQSEMRIEGDLSKGITSIMKAFPKETEKFMKAEARKFRNYVKDKAKTAVGKITGNYLRGFAAGRQVYEWSDSDYNVRVYNRAPHNHLIELGHALVGHRPNKVKIGRVKAFEVMNNALSEWQNRFESDVEGELMDFIIKELEK